MLRAFSWDLPCCGDRTHCKKRLGIFATFLRLGALLGSFRLEICHFCCVFVPRFAIGELATIANRKKVAIRTDFCFWVLSGYRAKVLPGCGIVMSPHCRARELFGRGVVMWPERGVAKHGRSRGFGRLPVYRVVLLLSLKISNATLLKLVFRYNERREFVEEQARSPL